MNTKLIFLSLVLLLLVIPCIVSADTLLVYTTGSNDGLLVRTSTENTFTSYRGGAGNSITSDATISRPRLHSTTTSDKYDTLARIYFVFNTSVLGSSASISSAVFGAYGHMTTSITLGDTGQGITGFTPATEGSVIVEDFNTFSDTRYAPDILVSVWSTSSYNNFTFNANGLNAINKTGYTNIMERLAWDIDNSSPTWVSSATTGAYSQMVEHGTTVRPFLEITYTTGVPAPVASFTCTKNFVRIPNSVTCADSSINTPTSWSWDMGDGSAAKTTQNVTYQYLKRGSWGITLNATNAGGSNITPTATNVKVVGYENVW